jgi:ATP-dependent Clp protease adaptor protein ClpS
MPTIAPDVPDIQTDTEVIERYEPFAALQRPDRVIIHNDDVTTFDFVIAVLIAIFDKSPAEASKLAWETDTKGLAHVASLPPEDARRRVAAAHHAARESNYPLRFTIEPGWLVN